ncbi:hypothetical protein AB0K00_10295 [Dactylosporangium sp. NPDC049525]|uniref:hypothetical protein n=1 Tax=Dactylosporangium sp. NPDC049525 TaxID=3154730 RepID=UPI0034304130
MTAPIVREDQMITVIRTLLRDDAVPDIADLPMWSLAGYLRQRQLVVTCTETACSIEAEFPN